MPTHEFNVPASGRLTLRARLGGGTCTVRAVPGLTRLRVTLRNQSQDSGIAEQTSVELDDSVLSINTPRPRRQNAFGGFGPLGQLATLVGLAGGGLEVTVDVPSETDISVTLLHGDVLLDGQCGNVDLAGGSGTVSVGDVGGNLRLRYGQLRGTVGRVAGALKLRAGAGGVRVVAVGGPAECDSSAGDIRIGEAAGRIRVRTGSGNIELAELRASADLTSGSGAISVGVAAGHPARVDLRTGQGRLHSTLPVNDARPADTALALEIRARTGRGDISLFRAQPRAMAEPSESISVD